MAQATNDSMAAAKPWLKQLLTASLQSPIPHQSVLDL